MKAFGILVASLALYVPLVVASPDPLAEAGRLLQAGQADAAMKVIDHLPAELAGTPRARFTRATALAATGQRAAAIEAFELLIEDLPDQPEVYNNLATLLAADGRLDEAREVLDRGMRTHAGYAAIYENLTAIYVRKASRSYARALQMNEAPAGPALSLLYDIPLPADAVVMVAEAEPPMAVPEPKAAPGERSVAVREPVAPTPAAATPTPVRGEDVAPPEAARVTAPVDEVAEAAAVPEAARRSVDADSRDPEAAVIAMLEAWAAAWSSQDVEAYLAFYATDFQPGHGRTRPQWESLRRERLARPEAIAVDVAEFELRVRDASRVRVDLVQRYVSPSYQDRTVKRFELVRINDDWRIREEKTLRVLP